MNYYTTKRKFKVFMYRIAAEFSSSKKTKHIRLLSKRNLNPSQACGIEITTRIIHDPLSKLYYDLETQECYIKREDKKTGTIYVFIESRNLKIINTVFGHDIPITLQIEQHLVSIFRKEMAKRRSQFKKEAIAKVDNSLQTILTKIKDE